MSTVKHHKKNMTGKQDKIHNHLQWLPALALGLILGASALLFANGMSKPPTRDEHMYCTAGVLMTQGEAIYRDFSYVSQLPYHPFLLAILYKSLGTTHYLLCARLVSILCEIGILLVLFFMFRQAFAPDRVAGTVLGLIGALFYAFNPLVYMANGYAWNHAPVVLCVLIASSLLVKSHTLQKYSAPVYGGIGILLTLACGMRITTSLIWGAFAVFLMAGPMIPKTQRKRMCLAFFIGTLLTALYPIWIIAQAPRAFGLNLYAIPRLYGQWLQAHGQTHNKLDVTIICLTSLGYFALLVGALWTHISAWYCRVIQTGRNIGPHFFLMALLAVCVIIAFIPPTMWRQYWAIPVPFIIMSLRYPVVTLWQQRKQHRHARIALVALLVCMLVTVLSHVRAIRSEPPTWKPSQWAPMKLHRQAARIAAATTTPQQILTLSPLLALEGGCRIYPELSCGSVVYRVGDQLPPHDRMTSHTVGSESLETLLKTSPPSGILVGTEDGLLKGIDASLATHAPAHWQHTRIDQNITLLHPSP